MMDGHKLFIPPIGGADKLNITYCNNGYERAESQRI